MHGKIGGIPGRDGQSWCVVGGGALGLTMARRLAAAGKTVTVLEASDHLGGLADGWRIGDIVWDRHYHVVLLSDFHLRGLLDELGLDDALCWSTTRAELFDGGAFHPLNDAIDYLRLPVLGLLDKARLAGTILYASRIGNGRPLETVGIEAWLTRWSGRRAYERVWRPLLRAKLGDNYRRASAAFIWAVIRRLYAARRSGLKTEMFGYIDGGYDRVFARYAEVLEGAGVRAITGCRVNAIEDTDSGLRVTGNGIDETFDRVVVTTAAPIANRMCKGLTAPERELLDGIVYQGIVCASVLLKKPLHGCYITYITDPTAPFTAVIEMSALVDRQKLGGHSLAYLPAYVTSDDPLFEESDEAVEARFTGRLLAMYPELSREDIEAFRISRVRQVLAVSTLNYSDRLPPMVTSVPGLYIVNSAHIVNGTLNVNETVELANRAANALLGLKGPAARTGKAEAARA